MSYTALYRKWRPDSFEDVKGQEAIVTTLKNQIMKDRIGHAYLFCGTRGTGKTTIAKIVAKAVNCENPKDGSPCGKCKSCKAIADGSSMNVIEMDAASNNGVEDVRLIRDEVAYAPADGKYKVYIIDEAHNLSSSAFNALLKTLEEPPSYVIFILATTEYSKIPITILSRCQRYDFKRISVDTIVERLYELMDGEGIEAEDKALRYIARVADGGLRDALSLFDQCSSFYYGQKLTYDMVLEALGAVDTRIFSDLLCAVIARDIKNSVEILGNVVESGRDLNQFVIDFTWYLRNLLLVKTSEEDEIDEVLEISSESVKQLKREASAVDQNRIMRFIRIFSELSNDIKFATQKRVLIEIAIIKLCKPDMEIDNGSLSDRIKALEERLDKGITVTKGERTPANAEVEEYEDIEPVPLPKAISSDIEQIVSKWPQICNMMSNPGMSFLRKSMLSVKDDKLIIVVNDPNGLFYFSKDSFREEFSKVIKKSIGKEVDFEIAQVGSKEEFIRKYPDLSAIKMEVVTED
ncbi:MAG: DNA polymerase III subunit gamma/tau [Lachnospiraceae bacterium]|nr:DNA polymerase III subunit gamma/tau [Lachnospiraceae bacterium]